MIIEQEKHLIYNLHSIIIILKPNILAYFYVNNLFTFYYNYIKTGKTKSSKIKVIININLSM